MDAATFLFSAFAACCILPWLSVLQCPTPLLRCTFVDLIDRCSAPAVSFSHLLRSSSDLTRLFWLVVDRILSRAMIVSAIFLFRSERLGVER